MAIVIHELEVVPQEKSASGAPATAQDPAPGKDKDGGIGLLDVQRIERHARERRLRVWAH